MTVQNNAPRVTTTAPVVRQAATPAAENAGAAGEQKQAAAGDELKLTGTKEAEAPKTDPASVAAGAMEAFKADLAKRAESTKGTKPELYQNLINKLAAEGRSIAAVAGITIAIQMTVQDSVKRFFDDIWATL